MHAKELPFPMVARNRLPAVMVSDAPRTSEARALPIVTGQLPPARRLAAQCLQLKIVPAARLVDCNDSQLDARVEGRSGSASAVRFGPAARQLRPHRQTFATTIQSSHSGPPGSLPTLGNYLRLGFEGGKLRNNPLAGKMGEPGIPAVGPPCFDGLVEMRALPPTSASSRCPNSQFSRCCGCS
jgi:hypothetical protein